MSTDMNVRIGMIGTGRWAGSLALEIAQTPGAELVSCWDRDSSALERFALEFGVASAGSLEEMLSDSSIDAGIACVPNASHKEIAVALAGARKHVFVPRPIANYVSAAREMVAAARASEVVLFVDHSSSFSREMDAMYEEVASNRVGRLIGGHAFRSADWAREAESASWHQSPRECPGGPATLLGVPAAATLVRFLGQPVGVRGSIASGLVPSRVPNVTTLLVEHESGAHSTLVASGVSAVPNDHLYFYGMNGVVLSGPTVTQTGQQAIVAEADSRVVRELQGRGDIRSGMAMFVDQVTNGGEPPASVSLAMTALATVEAGLRSVSENRRMSVSELLTGQ